MSICEPLASGTLSPDGRWPIAGGGSSRRSRRREPPVSKKKNIGVPRRRSVSDENEGRQNAPFHNEVALFDMRPFCRPSAVPRGSYYFAISPGVAQRCCFTPGYGLPPTFVGFNISRALWARAVSNAKSSITCDDSRQILKLYLVHCKS